MDFHKIHGPMIENLAFELMKHMHSSVSILAVNASIAKQGAIYRFRSIDDKDAGGSLDIASESGCDKVSDDNNAHSNNSEVICSYGRHPHIAPDMEEPTRQGDHGDLIHNPFNDLKASRVTDHMRERLIIPESHLFSQYLMLYLTSLEGLKLLSSNLAEQNAAFRITILPDEPVLENLTLEELQTHVLDHWGGSLTCMGGRKSRTEAGEIWDILQIKSFEKYVEDKKAQPKAYFPARGVVEEVAEGAVIPLLWSLRDASQLQIQTWHYYLNRKKAKETSKLYCFQKRLERKLKIRYPEFAQWLGDRENKKKDQIAERRAWDQGERAWRLSMLDATWWFVKSQYKEKQINLSVWDYEHYTLDRELNARRTE